MELRAMQTHAAMKRNLKRAKLLTTKVGSSSDIEERLKKKKRRNAQINKTIL